MLSLRLCLLCKLNCAAGGRLIVRLSAPAGFGFMKYICSPLASDPPKITTMRLVERTSTSLSLSWDVSPRPRVNSPPIRYELTYRKKVQWSCFFCRFGSLLTLHVICMLYFMSFFPLHINIIFYVWLLDTITAEQLHCLKIFAQYNSAGFCLCQINLHSMRKRHQERLKIKSVAAVFKVTFSP